MQCESDSVFSLAEMRRLLAEEWAIARARSVQVAAGPALSFAPEASQARVSLAGHPALARLHLAGNTFDGDVRCSLAELPWETDSVQLIVVRHITDCLAPDSGFESEIARILAPGGSLFMFGLNPLSTWRFWWARHTRRGLRAPRCSSAAHMRRVLERLDLETSHREFLGGAWPADAAPKQAQAAAGHGAVWHGAWLLIAQKQRALMRPIGTDDRQRRIALRPSLAQATSRRASA